MPETRDGGIPISEQIFCHHRLHHTSFIMRLLQTDARKNIAAEQYKVAIKLKHRKTEKMCARWIKKEINNGV